MSHISWRNIANEIVTGGNWGRDGASIREEIKNSTNDRISICLLLDIAESLRILRCSDFQLIPHRLKYIEDELKSLNRKKNRCHKKHVKVRR